MAPGPDPEGRVSQKARKARIQLAGSKARRQLTPVLRATQVGAT